MKHRLVTITLGLLLASCYVPTERRVYQDLDASYAGNDEASLQKALLEKIRPGTPRLQVRAILDRLFVQRDPLVRLYDPDERSGITLFVAYDVSGLEVCKDNVIAKFRFDGEPLKDIEVKTSATCL